MIENIIKNQKRKINRENEEILLVENSTKLVYESYVRREDKNQK